MLSVARPEDGVHGLHPYPAKFPAKVAGDILSRFACSGETVLDPFCGSGTTLVEARLRGINAVGADINGLACLLSRVKTTPLVACDFDGIRKVLAATECAAESRRPVASAPPSFTGSAHWFQDNVAHEIAFLLSLIARCVRAPARDFLRVALSSIVVRVSNQESDTRYAAVNKKIGDKVTLRMFVRKAADGVGRLRGFSRRAQKSAVSIHDADARRLSFLPSESVDCVITSPPYANSYDYYLYHKFRCVWLGLDFRRAQDREIGSRREFSSLKKSPAKWRADLRACLGEMRRILKARRSAFIIIGDSVIGGALLESDKLVAELAAETGFKVRAVKSSRQSGHSRSFNPAFARKGKREHFLHLEKDA